MKKSAGIIPYKIDNGEVKFFLGHPGGMNRPYYALLKGEVQEGEPEIEAAIREFGEESGVDLSLDMYRLEYLGEVQQNKNKRVAAYGVLVDDIDPTKCYSNLCEDGITPEIDKYAWLGYDEVMELSHRTHYEFYRKIMDKFV